MRLLYAFILSLSMDFILIFKRYTRNYSIAFGIVI